MTTVICRKHGVSNLALRTLHKSFGGAFPHLGFLLSRCRWHSTPLPSAAGAQQAIDRIVALHSLHLQYNVHSHIAIYCRNVMATSLQTAEIQINCTLHEASQQHVLLSRHGNAMRNNKSYSFLLYPLLAITIYNQLQSWRSTLRSSTSIPATFFL